MTQTFPLVSIDPATKTGTQLAADLENFSATVRSMMSGPERADAFVSGLWLRTHGDGTAAVVYSDAALDIDLPLFTIAGDGTLASLGAAVSLSGAAGASAGAAGVIQLATTAEALDGVVVDKVAVVADTQAMIAAAIGALVDGSAAALDTLNELASALGNDPDFAATVSTALAKRVRVDAPQTLSVGEQAQARANLALGAVALADTVPTPLLAEGAVTAGKVAAGAITRAKLAAETLATAAQTLTDSPPADQALTPQAFFTADEVAVVDVPANAPTTLAENGYRRRFFVQSTGGMYAYVPAPIAAFVLQGTAPAALGDLADVTLAGASDHMALVHQGGAYVPQFGLVPLGGVLMHTAVTVPAPFLRCDGTAVSRTTYAALFALIGETYGQGDGSTTFNLPNLIDRFPMGAGLLHLGIEREAGLPNITGAVANVLSETNNATTSGTGALYEHSRSAGRNSPGSGTGGMYGHLRFDAGQSDPIYGNATTVQPPALTVSFIIRAA